LARSDYILLAINNNGPQLWLRAASGDCLSISLIINC